MRRFSLLLVCVLGLAVGAATTVALRYREPTPIVADSAAKAVPDSGVQEVAVFIGASWCAASAFPQLKDSLPLLLKRLETEARSRNHWFSTIGVSLDVPAKKGIEWLNEYGTFGQLIVGGGWGNYAVLDLIWSDLSSAPELPQLVILSRPILASTPRIRLGPVTVRERVSGAQPILLRLSSDQAQSLSNANPTLGVGR